MMTKVLGKYRQPTDEDLKVIEERVQAGSQDGIYSEPGKMAVIWWRKA